MSVFSQCSTLLHHPKLQPGNGAAHSGQISNQSIQSSDHSWDLLRLEREHETDASTQEPVTWTRLAHSMLGAMISSQHGKCHLLHGEPEEYHEFSVTGHGTRSCTMGTPQPWYWWNSVGPGPWGYSRKLEYRSKRRPHLLKWESVGRETMTTIKRGVCGTRSFLEAANF